MNKPTLTQSILLYIFLFLIQIGLAQEVPRFKQIDLGDGAVQSPVSGFYQDKVGFIWIGTYNGLVRYDGNEINYFRKNRKDEQSLSNNHINAIFEDRSGNIWVGTHNGVNRYDAESSSFKPVDIRWEQKGGINYITSFAEDADNKIWVGTFGGLKLLDADNDRLLDLPFTDATEDSGYTKIFCLYLDKSGVLWIGTAGGLKRIDTLNGALLDLPEAFGKNDFAKAKVWKIVEDGDDMWFASETNGAMRYSKEEGKLENFLHTPDDDEAIASNWVNDIILEGNSIWFATNAGLSIYSKESNAFYNPAKESANGDAPNIDIAINKFLRDRQGSIWLGAQSGTIAIYNSVNARFVNIDHVVGADFGLNNDIVSAFLKEDEDSFWVGTYGGGLNFMDFKNKTTKVFRLQDEDGATSNIITSLERIAQGHLLVGTFNGLFEFSRSGKQFKRITLHPQGKIVKDRPVTKILRQGDSTWVATHGDGLKLLIKGILSKSYRATSQEGGLSDNFITDLERGDGGIWIATQDGLDFFDLANDRFKRHFKSDGPNTLVNNVLTSLFKDRSGRLWIGTDFGGLMYMDQASGRFYAINSTNGFTDDRVLEITDDKDGNLWVSTINSIYKIRLNHFQVPFSEDPFEITRYSNQDGLEIKQFSLNTSMSLSNEKMVFGGINGLVMFNPGKLEKCNLNDKILFTKLRINNQEINVADKGSPLEEPIYKVSEIFLNHRQSFIGLDFSTFNYVNAESNSYQYKIDKIPGTSDQWSSLGDHNGLSLGELGHGDFRISVRGVDENNNVIAEATSFILHISPPWWLSWWAYLIYTFTGVIILLTILHFVRNRWLLKRTLFLENLENERKQEIYKMKLDFFTNISHELRTPLTLINGPIETLMEDFKEDAAVKTKLESVKRNSDRLVKLINELMDFRKAEKGNLKLYCEEQDLVQFCYNIFESFRSVAEKKKIDYKFVMTNSKVWVYFDSLQLEKVVYNLLANAFKFTPDQGKISVVLERRNDDSGQGWVDLLIKDNGIGISDKTKSNIFQYFFQADDKRIQSMGSGIGLALSKSIVELHKGEIEVTSEKVPRGNFSNTTIFKISLKEGKSHLDEYQIVDKPVSEQGNLSEDNSLTEAGLNCVLPDEELALGGLMNTAIPQKEVLETRKTIYVADDNPEIRQFVFDILSEQYNVRLFEGGRQVLEQAEKEIPDLFICDIMMPEMDGLELCQIIKSTESTNHIPVILLTAKSSTISRIEGLSSGADCYIAKPFSVKVFKLNVENILAAKDIMKEKYAGRFIVDSDLKQLSTPEDLFIKKLMQIIESNLEDPSFDVNELVKQIGMSRTVLYKKVQTITNHSVANLIKRIRLKKASAIIMETNFSVSEVAYMVGFNDRKHFSKEFKKLFGNTPTEFKNEFLQKDKTHSVH